MALTTYDGLKAALALMLNRDDLEDAIPDFIRLCEMDVDARLDLATHRRRICRSTAVIDDEYERLPANYMAVQTIDIEDPAVIRLLRVDPDNLLAMKEDVTGWRSRITSETGLSVAPPRFYAVVGREIRFFPAPQQEYTVLLNVYERLSNLSDTTASNWLLDYYPSIYLYGAALHSAPFLRDDERIPMWERLYERGCQLAAQSDPEETDRTTLRADAGLMIGRNAGSINNGWA